MATIGEKHSEQIKKDDAALLAKFTHDMMPTKLFWQEPTSEYHLWVFWSHEPIDSEHASTNQGIQDRIKIALSKFYAYIVDASDVLVQFWAAKMTGERCHLTTTLQPFALNKLTNEKLNEYRKHCVGYKLNDGDLSMDGIVSRVFRNKLPECCGDLSKYSVRDYPQRDLAFSCRINSTLTIPLFESEPGYGGVLGCGGVLEVLFTTKSSPKYWWYFYWLNEHLKINDLYEGPIKKEIKAALKQVCNTYDLSRGITWVSYGRNMSCKDSQGSFQGELLVPSPAMSIFPPSVAMEIYFCNAFCQGLAEKAFLHNNPYFCRDVSKLIKRDYILALMASRLKLASCFIVCLRNISTGKHELVIKFFQKRKTYSGDLVTLFSSILPTMKQKLKTFEVVTDPQNEIFIEVDELGESFVKPMTTKGERIPTEYSLQSLHSKPKSSFSVNECVQRADLDNGYESEQSSFGNSETRSTKWEKRLGYMISANGPHIPILNQHRTESSNSDGPLSEASAVVAQNIPPCTPESHVEWMTIKVSYVEEDMIIKFDLPTSSSKEDLLKEVIMRIGDKLKDKAFVIKYLDDVSLEPSLLIATDKEWKECIVRTRLWGKKLIRMVIELEKDV